MSGENISDFDKAIEEAGLSDVAKTGFFPYGVQITEVDGGKLLRGISVSEYKKLVWDKLQREVPEIEQLSPSCGVSSSRCYSAGCTQAGRGCDGPFSGGLGYWFCTCA